MYEASRDEIPVYKDQVILDISTRFHKLDSEQLNLMLSKQEFNEAGRSAGDIAKDTIVELEAMNAHLRMAYPENRAAQIYITTNQFVIDRLKEELEG